VIDVSTPILGPVDCGADQIISAIYSRAGEPKYDRRQVENIAHGLVYWSGLFGIRTAILAGQIMHETGYFRYGGDVRPEQFNFAGLGATGGIAGAGFPTIDAGIIAVCAHHLVYCLGSKEHWPEHLRQYADRDPRYQAVISAGTAGSVTVLGDHRGKWAYPGTTYPERVRDAANLILSQPRNEEPTMPDRSFHVAISYGHRNTDGGNAIEREQTPKIGAAVVTACRARGMEVYNVHDEVGLNPNLGLQGIARKVVEKHNSGWPVDLYLEVHTEGAGPNARGVFAIYPDTGDDVDLDAKRVGQDAAKRIAQAVGIGLRGDGTMSERNTGVGAQGHRLGVFLVTAAIKATTTRMIIEYGSHDNQDDLQAIMGNLPAVGAATAEAFAEEAKRLGFTVGSEPVPPASNEPDCIVFEETGKKLCHGFRAYWEKWGGLRIFGYPLTDEFEENGMTVQYFERARFELMPQGSDPDNYDVQLGRIGDELLKAKEAA
jgi:hypothetical protein